VHIYSEEVKQKVEVPWCPFFPEARRHHGLCGSSLPPFPPGLESKDSRDLGAGVPSCSKAYPNLKNTRLIGQKIGAAFSGSV
jgi:hypothetical protein